MVLPFGDGEFSAVTAVFAPYDSAEVFRVLRPGGRFVMADNDAPRPVAIVRQADPCQRDSRR